MDNNKNDEKKINIIGNYEIGNTIGEGAFVKVKLAKHIPTGKASAIKILDKIKNNANCEILKIKREVDFLKMLSNKNIITLYEIIETEAYYCIALEYAKEGDLLSYIISQNCLKEKKSYGSLCKLSNQLTIYIKNT